MGIASLTPRQRLVLAIDTSDQSVARDLMLIAERAGVTAVKLGLELSSATSWKWCANLAADFGMEWIADAKLHDIPNTVEGAVRNITHQAHPPFAITMHANGGVEMMYAAQEAADEIGATMLAVTVLTSIGEIETAHIYRTPEVEERPGNIIELSPRDMVVRSFAADITLAKAKGIVCSALEVAMVKKEQPDLTVLVPGTRSLGVDAHDQKATGTPAKAVADGADLLVIGRQVTQADSPAAAFEAIVNEIEAVSA